MHNHSFPKIMLDHRKQGWGVVYFEFMNFGKNSKFNEYLVEC